MVKIPESINRFVKAMLALMSVYPFDGFNGVGEIKLRQYGW
jgi:hypothetical protein